MYYLIIWLFPSGWLIVNSQLSITSDLRGLSQLHHIIIINYLHIAQLIDHKHGAG